jgi:probable O-glycosylation ligase (exosortase A-associated)
MPESWQNRMGTIQTYEQDGSAMGRINAWWMAFNLAKDNLFGGGFECFQRYTFYLYAPVPNDLHDAHSVYFEVLGEHGFIGITLFLLLGLVTLNSARKIIKEAKKSEETLWMSDLAAMLQVSLIGYAASGAFLGLAYFDLYYHLIAIVVILKALLVKSTRNGLPAASKEKLSNRSHFSDSDIDYRSRERQ